MIYLVTKIDYDDWEKHNCYISERMGYSESHEQAQDFINWLIPRYKTYPGEFDGSETFPKFDITEVKPDWWFMGREVKN